MTAGPGGNSAAGGFVLGPHQIGGATKGDTGASALFRYLGDANPFEAEEENAGFSELKTLTPSQRNAFVASFLGWTLDAFDFFLMSFTLGAIATDFHVALTEVAFAITAIVIVVLAAVGVEKKGVVFGSAESS